MWRTGFFCLGFLKFNTRPATGSYMDQNFLSEDKTMLWNTPTRHLKRGRLLRRGSDLIREKWHSERKHRGHQSLVFWSDSDIELLKRNTWMRQSQVHFWSHTGSPLLCSPNSIYCRTRISEAEPASQHHRFLVLSKAGHDSKGHKIISWLK